VLSVIEWLWLFHSTLWSGGAGDLTGATEKVSVNPMAIARSLIPIVGFIRSFGLFGRGRLGVNDKRRGSLRASYKRVAEIGKNLAGSDNRVRLS
jgi:hypothetical protein